MKFEFTSYRNAPKTKIINIRITEELDSKIDEFSKRIELPRAETIRLIVADTIKTFTYAGKDELYNPYWDKLSDILDLLKDKKMMSEIEDLNAKDMNDPAKIAGIMKKYS